MSGKDAKLRAVIDRMVEDSIRRILPQVMNEVLLKTLTNSNVIREAPPVRKTVEGPTRRPAGKRPSSLDQILDPEAGTDFYNDPREAMRESLRVDEVPQEVPSPAIAQRIQALPPELRAMAEGVSLIGSEDSVPMVPEGPSLERAAQVAGLDFTRMRKAVAITEKKVPKAESSDRAAREQFEEMRIKRMRERLNGGKPV